MKTNPLLRDPTDREINQWTRQWGPPCPYEVRAQRKRKQALMKRALVVLAIAVTIAAACWIWNDFQNWQDLRALQMQEEY